MTTETGLKSVSRDGVSLSYREAGTGDPPILFVHGWTCNHTNFRDQIPHFAASHRVVALDQRGHGSSGKPDQDYTIPGFVDDLAWFMSKTNLDRPVIVGHSMGGTIALNFAHKHPDLTRGIVLIDSPVVPLPAALEPVLEQTLAAFKSPSYRAMQEGFARAQFFSADTPPALVEELIGSMGEAPQRLIHTAMEGLLAPESMPAGPIPVPALFIRAATAYASEEAFSERYPGMNVRTVDAAHFLQMEKPSETNALIEEFVRRVA